MTTSTNPWSIVLQRVGPREARRLARYRDNPAAFAADCIRWPAGRSLTAYQAEILEELPTAGRYAVRGPHSLGKTTIASIATLWFSTTRDEGDGDWKVPTTASAWRQLTHFLWPEIHKWARRLDWDKLGRPPFRDGVETLDRILRLRHGEAFAVASNQPTSIEGAHADSLLYVYDEAKVIPTATFDAAEGAFAGAGPDTPSEAFALAVSTPGEPNGHFYDIHARKPGTDDWTARHVTLEECIAAGQVSADWAARRARQWGTSSAVYANRVLGEFASGDEDGVVPLAWVELANDRWRAMCGLDAEGRPDVDAFREPAEPLDAVGVDVADGGADATVMALRWGEVIGPLRRTRFEDTMATSGRVVGVLEGRGGRAVVDGIGIGSGVVNRLRELGRPVSAFIANGATHRKDASGELGFVDCRAAAWWNMRELLDPAGGHEVALPPDDLLTGDLTAPHWRVMSGGRIRVESKDEIRPRIGRSTDSGDAVVQAFWEEYVSISGNSADLLLSLGRWSRREPWR